MRRSGVTVIMQRGAIGKFGFGEINERSVRLLNETGERLLTFCLSNNLKIMNAAFFQRKGNIQWTWKSPDGVTKNKIDYILVNERCQSSVSTC